MKGSTISGNSETHDSATVLYQWQKLNLRRYSSDHNDANISKTFCCAPGCKEWPSYTAHTDSQDWKGQLPLRSRSMSRKRIPFYIMWNSSKGSNESSNTWLCITIPVALYVPSNESQARSRSFIFFLELLTPNVHKHCARHSSTSRTLDLGAVFDLQSD